MTATTSSIELACYLLRCTVDVRVVGRWPLANGRDALRRPMFVVFSFGKPVFAFPEFRAVASTEPLGHVALSIYRHDVLQLGTARLPFSGRRLLDTYRQGSPGRLSRNTCCPLRRHAPWNWLLLSWR